MHARCQWLGCAVRVWLLWGPAATELEAGFLNGLCHTAGGHLAERAAWEQMKNTPSLQRKSWDFPRMSSVSMC